MDKVYRYFIGMSLAAFLLSSCAGFEPTLASATSSPVPTFLITPYLTPTSTPAIASPTAAASPTATRLPSPTPFTHTIEEGDMLGGIAFQYGLTVEDLLAANPGVDPSLLKIGSTLVVPLEPEEAVIVVTPVPLPVRLDMPDCYPTSDEGTFCFVMATNQGETDLENLSAKIDFLTEDGEKVAEEIALPPLNVLPAGDALPVLAFFPAPLQPGLDVRAEVISAFPLLEDNSRYLAADAEVETILIEPDGNQALIQGQVVLPFGSESPDYLWLAAVAYGENGEVVGVRKWEANGDDYCPKQDSGIATPEAGGDSGCLSFDITVFSLGPEIETVEILVEAGFQTVLQETP